MIRTHRAVSIRTGTAADTDVVTALLAEAFLTGAVADWLVPDPAVRREIYLAFFRLEVERALQSGYVHLAADQSAVALWQLRMRPPTDSADDVERLTEVCGPFTDRFTALARVFADHHPAVPHHYLAYLAVAPRRQNSGLGAALLDHQHAALDRATIPAYLEASNVNNRRLYLRHGYRSAAPFHLPFDGPPLWPMWRDPRPV